MSYCPVHRLVYQGDEGFPQGTHNCPRCKSLGIVCAGDVEIDKISRVIDTMNEQGYQLEPISVGTFARLVFRRPKEE